MRHARTTLSFAVSLLCAGLAFAGPADREKKEKASGHEASVQAVTEAMVRTEIHLNEVLAKVPEAAKEGVQRAIDASRAGREKALAALQGTETDTEAAATASASASASAGLAKAGADVSGNARAKVAIAEGTSHAEAALTAAMERADVAAKQALTDALDHVRSGAKDALAALDRVRPERPERVEAAAAVKGAAEVKPPRPR